MNTNKEQIIDILTQYEEMAQANANVFWRLIPANEVWRFFIDGEQQTHGRRLHLSSYFEESLQSASLFSSAKPLEMTVKEYVEKQEKLNLPKEWKKSELRRFLNEKKWFLTNEECEKFTLRDLLMLDKAWLPFERNEPGYLKGLYLASQQIHEFNTPLNLAFIKQLHKLAVGNVSGTNYGEEVTESAGEFRQDEPGQFGLVAGNTTVDGLKEIIQEKNPSLSFQLKLSNPTDNMSIGSITINKDSLKEIKYFMDDLSKEKKSSVKVINYGLPLLKYCDVFEQDEFVDHLKSDKATQAVLQALAAIKTDDDYANILHRVASGTDFPKHIQLALKSDQYFDVHKKITTEMQKIVDGFNQKINTVKEPVDKIAAIIEISKQCSQLHPFSDANCRVFDMLLLNHLLMRYGFPPAILTDPNRFDAYSKVELVPEVLQGMQNSLTLVKEKKLFDVDTNKVREFLQSKPHFEKMLSYFDDTVALESASRHQHKLTLS